MAAGRGAGGSVGCRDIFGATKRTANRQRDAERQRVWQVVREYKCSVFFVGILLTQQVQQDWTQIDGNFGFLVQSDLQKKLAVGLF